MSAYSKTVNESPAKVLERAVSYFGPEGLGLSSRGIEDDCANFEGGGGHVAISACENDGKTDIELETQEWDIQVREFLKQF
ncbi:MAG: hypothetical protein WBO97_17125 [Tepidiformaceae bacterium]